VRGTAKTVVVDTEVSTKGQGNTKLSPVDHSVDGILDLVQKGSNTKKKKEKVFVTRILKDWTKFTTQNEKKRKSKVFYPDNFTTTIFRLICHDVYV
jgi:hypothetical protein